MSRLSAAQADRACGVLLGVACGDALGAGYEFGTARLEGRPGMIGGGLGGFEPGEWTDDTAMTFAIAEVAASGADLRSPEALDAIARGFAAWHGSGPADIGIQTGRVLAAVRSEPTAARMTAVAQELHDRTGHTAGNGSLMRTAPVALAHLDDPVALAEAATMVSALTHADPVAGEACVLWSLAIRHAVLTGELDVRVGLELLVEESRMLWEDRLDQAERHDPTSFVPNGYVVTALQAAWSAISHTPVPDHAPSAGSFACGHLVNALEAAVAIGDDTDTVAAIAGALLGAGWGASAAPYEWRSLIHGWPAATDRDLVALALLAVNGGHPDRVGWPVGGRVDCSWVESSRVTHPYDAGVYLGTVATLDELPPDVTAVVSLCRVGRAQVPEGFAHAVFRLLDTSVEDNPNLEFVIDDAARTVARLRAEGHVVLLHCVASQSRTPTVAARYAVRRGVPLDDAWDTVLAALPAPMPNAELVRGLRALGEPPS